MEKLKEKVFLIIAEHLGVEKSKITMDSDFVNDLGADSLDSVELVMAAEEEFDIEIPDKDIEGITKVSEAIEYLISQGCLDI